MKHFLFVCVLACSFNSLEAAFIRSSKEIPADIKTALPSTRQLLKRVQDFNGDDDVTLQSIETRLKSLGRQVPMPAFITQIFATRADQLPKLAQQPCILQEPPSIIFDYFLFFITLHSIECIAIKKAAPYYHSLEDKVNEYFVKHDSLNDFMFTFFCQDKTTILSQTLSETNQELVRLYVSSNNMYCTLHKAATINRSKAYPETLDQNNSCKNCYIRFCKNLKTFLGRLIKLKI